MFVTSRTGVKTAEDLRRIPVVAGSWGNTTDSFVTPTLLNALGSTQFKIITGYRGAADVDLAVERDEADARVASWTSVKTTRGDWLKDGKIVVPFQTGSSATRICRNLPLVERSCHQRGRPTDSHFMNSDSSVGWNVVAPPSVPADRVALLREAFDATRARSGIPRGGAKART